MKLLNSMKKNIESSEQLVFENLKLLSLSIVLSFVAMYIGSFLEAIAVFVVKGRTIGNPIDFLLESPFNIYRHSVVGKVFAIISILPMLRISQLYSLESLKDLPVLQAYPALRITYWLPIVICLYRQIMEPYYPATSLFILSFVFYVGVVALAVKFGKIGLKAV